MFVVDIRGCDIMLGDEWLRTLGPMTMDFKEFYMSFVEDSHTHILQGIQVGPPTFINFHRMEKLLKKGNSSIIAQLQTIQALETSPPSITTDLQQVLDKHSLDFEIPKGLPPS